MELWIILLLIVLFLYILLDVHYLLRVPFVYVYGKYFGKKLGFFESSVIYGICIPTDADFFLTHMNNSRYLREYDFARFDYFTRTGLMNAIMRKGGNFPVSAITVRFRQPLWMFSPYKVITTPVWWDSKNLYLDQRVVTLKDNIVRSVGYTKVGMVKVDFEDIVKSVFPNIDKPNVPQDLHKWIESNDISSNNMKKTK